MSGDTFNSADVDRACAIMHDAYEESAARMGWETQERSRKPWSEVPEANKATVRVAVAALLEHLDADWLPPTTTVRVRLLLNEWEHGEYSATEVEPGIAYCAKELRGVLTEEAPC